MHPPRDIGTIEQEREARYYLELAEFVAMKSPCLRRHVGAVLVKNGRVVQTACNHPPDYAGDEVCTKHGCARPTSESGRDLEFCRAIHAEMAAISGTDLDELNGAILYCTHQPCPKCATALGQAHVRVIFTYVYPDQQPCKLPVGMLVGILIFMLILWLIFTLMG